MSGLNTQTGAAPSRGRFANSGNGPALQPVDIGHDSFIALVEPDSAFWMLLKKDKLAQALADEDIIKAQKAKAAEFADEMEMLRFGLKPSAVYFNPTERCNLNCTYCYIPENMRQDGITMSKERMFEALDKLKAYFSKNMTDGRLPQVVFHGAEPMIAREEVFAAIDNYKKDFRFGVQTNATLLDDEAIEFMKSTGTGIGISLDGHTDKIAGITRKTWNDEGVFKSVVDAMEKLKGYEAYNVIATVTDQNMGQLVELVDFFHDHEVPACMLNVVRCTLPGARTVKPDDDKAAKHFIKALDRTYELYSKTGRKLVVANFANILVSIVAPTARRLMCDISPCGGGRCFFALAPTGDMFPCSEFIGLPEFNGGNLFKDNPEDVIQSEAFNKVTGRKVEDIDPCNRCSIRHFCGSPCPAEAHEMNGSMSATGAFCEFYEEQVRYAFRLIADKKENAFLWDGWDEGVKTTFETDMLIA